MFICRRGVSDRGSLLGSFSKPRRGERSGPIQDEARNSGCHTDRHSSPHSFTTTGKQDGHPGSRWITLLVPAWAREEEKKKENIFIFGIIEYLSHHAQTASHIESVRFTNESPTIKPETEVHDEDPEVLICHQAVGSGDRHGEDFSYSSYHSTRPLHQ
jgi:hypothetical protein